jgi:O-antigen ligase
MSVHKTVSHTLRTHPALQYVPLALATIGVGYALLRMIVPALAMPLLAVPPVLVLLWFAWRWTQPQQRVSTPLGVPLLIGSIVLVASSVQAVANSADVVAILFFWGAAGGVILFLMISMMAWGWHPRIFVRAMLLTITILLIHATWTILSAWVAWPGLREPGDPWLPQNVSANLLGMHHTEAVIPLYSGIPLAIAALWQATKRWEQWLWGIWLFWAVVAVFYTSSRGGWLAMAFATGVILFPLLWGAYRARQVRRLVVGGGLAAGYVVLFAALLVGYSSVVAGATAVSEKAVSSAPDDSSDASGDNGDQHLSESLQDMTGFMGREVFWRRALDMVKARPLLGVGPGGFSVCYQALEPERSEHFLPPHTHNLYLAFLTELGIAGAGAFLVVSGTIAWLWWRSWQTTDPGSENRLLLLACGAVWAGTALHGLVDVPAPQNGQLALYALAVGVGIGGFWKLSGGNPPAPATVERADGGTPATFWHSLTVPHVAHLVLVGAVVLAWVVATLVFLTG